MVMQKQKQEYAAKVADTERKSHETRRTVMREYDEKVSILQNELKVSAEQHALAMDSQKRELEKKVEAIERKYRERRDSSRSSGSSGDPAKGKEPGKGKMHGKGKGKMTTEAHEKHVYLHGQRQGQREGGTWSTRMNKGKGPAGENREEHISRTEGDGFYHLARIMERYAGDEEDGSYHIARIMERYEP